VIADSSAISSSRIARMVIMARVSVPAGAGRSNR
jgi:hypothetical protein